MQPPGAKDSAPRSPAPVTKAGQGGSSLQTCKLRQLQSSLTGSIQLLSPGVKKCVCHYFFGEIVVEGGNLYH